MHRYTPMKMNGQEIPPNCPVNALRSTPEATRVNSSVRMAKRDGAAHGGPVMRGELTTRRHLLGLTHPFRRFVCSCFLEQSIRSSIIIERQLLLWWK
ncbi:hypothetical protein AVEN_29427-1 [Araneus ventricosus]|uniref:Uncharacterized protein n=1 Tax=Araneus ventricosus TaxID=182803 RepID=A0A4Y2D0S7_ARAVE|nr:hypothetical protein AVEN_29427-1 [Araneus ventricosus]